ncbi:MAG: T9SS type A sorting domain-containing protein [Bacteroidetes bacterium]|nr:T9SS type A sorting domain-containing protein [Bacteroidota bacterium]
MKKITLLLGLSVLMASASQAQSSSTISVADYQTNVSNLVGTPKGPSEKTAGLSDTLYGGTIYQFRASKALYIDYALPLDSGAFYGTNAAGYKGSAQLFRYASVETTAPKDTTYNVVGILSRWFGKVQTTSTKNVVFSIWKRSTSKTAVSGATKMYVYGAPRTPAIATKSVPVTSLSLTGSTITWLTTPLAALDSDIYVGYTISYNASNLGGDTVGVRSNDTVGNTTFAVETSTLDTLINARVMIQNAMGNWVSPRFDLNVGNGGDLGMMPIIRLNCPNCHATNINGINSKSLTFKGHYPNPASHQTTMRFSLQKSTDVSITVYDMSGRLLQTTVLNAASAGDQEMTISVENLPSGNYVYAIETKDGGAIACQFTVVK